MQAAPAGLGAGVAADGVGEARLLVDRDVVDRAHLPVARVRPQLRELGESAKPGEIENLHPVAGDVVRDDVRVILVHLHVAPAAVRGRRGHEGDGARFGRGREIDDGEPVVPAHQRVLHARLRVGPPPDVVHGPSVRRSRRRPSRAQVRHGYVRREIHAVAREPGGRTARAGDDLRRDGRRRRRFGRRRSAAARDRADRSAESPHATAATATRASAGDAAHQWLSRSRAPRSLPGSASGFGVNLLIQPPL